MRGTIAALAASLALALGGCVTPPPSGGTAEDAASLSGTINAIKRELRIYQREIADRDTAIQCGAAGGPLKLEIDAITATLGLVSGRTVSAGGGLSTETPIAIGVAASQSRAEQGSNKLVLKMGVDEIPADTTDEDPQPGGLAEALLSFVDGLIAADHEEPCLIGQSAAITVGFEVVETSEVGGEVSLLIVSMQGGEEVSLKGYNTVEVTYALDGSFVAPP